MRFRVALALICLALPALAYNEAVHALITRRAFEEPPPGDALLQPPGEADLAALRALFWETAARLPEGTLRAKFLARFPTEGSLDAWSFKEFLLLNPAARVHGFDLTPDTNGPLSRLELLVQASRWPDDDKRNQDRFARDAGRQILRAPDGTELPDDPATLDLGGLKGGTSQGHAHYGLVEGPLSDDPEVLKQDPAHFAVPKTAHAYGAEFAQLYTDLALLSATSGLPSRDWLSTTFEGAAFHHLEDLANQIHTVQVGIYDFFEAAFIQSKLRDAKTLGGLLGERRTLKQIGIRLIANHHLLSEDLFAKRIAEGSPEVKPALAALQEADPSYAAQVKPGPFGRGLAQALIELSSKEAPQVYRLAFAFSAKTLRDGMGHEYDGAKGDDPDRYLEPGEKSAAAQREFHSLEANGLRRAATALKFWQRDFAAELGRDPKAVQRDAVLRTLELLIPYHEAQAARRGLMPRSYMWLRWGLSAVVLVCLLSVVLIRAFGGRIVL